MSNCTTGTNPKTVGADKGYHQKAFVAGCREREVSPHVACKEGVRVPGLDKRTTGRSGCQTSLRIRKRVEEIFGWMKTVGGMRRTRYRGIERTQAWGYFVAALTTCCGWRDWRWSGPAKPEGSGRKPL
jgi:IS5 family transposase